MAIDIESIIIDTLLTLVEDEGEQLERITVRRILEHSGVSRQTFYNHFLDKNDLICQVYEQRMVVAFNGAQEGFAYREELVKALRRMRGHGVFLRQACKISGQNNLASHMLERATRFDLEWHQRLWGTDPMPEELRLATIYHVTASVQMSLSWILTGFSTPEEELADLISRMREIGMEALFKDAQAPGNPYAG